MINRHFCNIPHHFILRVKTRPIQDYIFTGNENSNCSEYGTHVAYVSALQQVALLFLSMGLDDHKVKTKKILEKELNGHCIVTIVTHNFHRLVAQQMKVIRPIHPTQDDLGLHVLINCVCNKVHQQ